MPVWNRSAGTMSSSSSRMASLVMSSRLFLGRGLESGVARKGWRGRGVDWGRGEAGGGGFVAAEELGRCSAWRDGRAGVGVVCLVK